MSETDRIARAYQDLDARAGHRWNAANPGNRAILRERRRRTAALLGAAGWLPLEGRRVLEVGSGGGGELAWLCELGAKPSQLVGVDLLPDRVAAARKAYPEIDFREANAEHVPFPDSSFDLVLAITVFSSILDPHMQRNVAAEIVRVMRPGGALYWYDVRYDSNTNASVRAVREARVRELFSSLSGPLKTVTLLPPLARRLGPLTAVAYPALSVAPPLRSHLIGLLRKPAS